MIESKLNEFRATVESFSNKPRPPFKTSIKGVLNKDLSEILSVLESIVSEYKYLTLSVKKWLEKNRTWTLYPEIKHIDYVHEPKQKLSGKVRPSPKEPLCQTDGYVYIIECNGLYKIGKANNVNARLVTMQTGNPYKLELITKYKFKESMALTVEKLLHEKLKNFRITGEWFNFQGGDPVEIVGDVLNSLQVITKQ